ncbi:MAG: MBL fold metallo-hydrolase [Gemmatimonadetes bacterium]|nr:MBL fold metallo-hydrolase [Gemmatimonadota bacterium]
MTPRFVRLPLAALAAAALLAAPARLAAQAGLDTVTIRTIKITDGLYMLVGSGGNLGVSVGEDGTVLVDDQFAPLTPKILAAIKAITPNPVKFLMNTHWHGDHTGGNENLGKAGVVIVAQDNVRERMSKETFVARLNRTQPASPKAALPVVTFPETMTLHLNGEDITAMHLAHAHTDGDVLIKFARANVIHGGDVFMRIGFPFIDVSSGGSLLGSIAGIERILAASDANTRFIPGHGELATRADVEAHLKLLKDVRDRTQAAIRKKQALDAFLAGKPLADYEAKFGANGFVKADDILKLAFAELGGGK